MAPAARRLEAEGANSRGLCDRAALLIHCHDRAVDRAGVDRALRHRVLLELRAVQQSHANGAREVGGVADASWSGPNEMTSRASAMRAMPAPVGSIVRAGMPKWSGVGAGALDQPSWRPVPALASVGSTMAPPSGSS